MTHTPPPTQDELAAVQKWLAAQDKLAAQLSEAFREIRELDAKVQNVWAVIDRFDNAYVSPTPDQGEVLDALRKALRT